MSLKYRGLSYQSNTVTLPTPQTQTEGKYRGQSYQIKQSEIQVKPSHLPMIYRGVKYNCSENLTTSQTGLLIDSLSV